MLTRYASSTEFLSAVADHLPAVPLEVKSAVLEGISAGDQALRLAAPEEETFSYNLRVGRWVIRDDDLPFFQTLGSVSVAVATSLGTGGLALPSIATAIVGFADLCWRMWRKGARLSHTQMDVYGMLRAHGPISTAALVKWLPGKTEEDITATLESLSNIDLNNGTVVTLASADANHFWKALKI